MLRSISNNLRNSNHLLRRHIRSTNNAILTPFNNDNNSSNQQQVRHMNRNARKPKRANGGNRPCSSVNRRKRRGRVKVKNGKLQR